MSTIFDWISIVLFSGVAVLFLQRSAAANPSDRIWQYLPATGGCVGSNYLGNHDQAALATGVLVASLAYIYYVLKPFDRG